MSMFETRRPPLPVAIPARGIMTLIACAIVIAGLYFGRDLLVPIVLAVLLAFVLAPVVRGRKGEYLAALEVCRHLIQFDDALVREFPAG